ncbi:MAG: chemotaxis protein CheW [Pelovirga sp.]
MTGFGLFRAGDLNYAIPLVQIRRIVQEQVIYPLPGLPAGIDFVLIYDGNLVPVLFSAFAPDNSRSTDNSSCYALVDSEYGLLALATESSSRIVAEHKGELSVASTSKRPWQTGTFTYQGQDFDILEIDVLATEIARGNGLNDLALSGTRRLNEEETAAGR